MTRKDFNLIARNVRDCIEHERKDGCVEGVAALEAFARAVAWDLADTNPRFDRGRFLRAAGVES